MSAPASSAPVGGRLRPLLSHALLRTQSDERLVELARGGHEIAFATLAQRYQRELLSHARGIVRRTEAEDVLQQTLLRAWTALQRPVAIENPRAWLHRIAHNTALNAVGKRGYADCELVGARSAACQTEDLVHDRLAAAEALDAVARLPVGQREALTLTAIDGRSGRDAALAMGISEGGLRQLVRRARSSVRSAVGAVVPFPLLNWAIDAPHSAAAGVALGAGTGAGLALTAAKVAAVVGLAGAAIGGTSSVLAHHHHRHRPTLAASALTRRPSQHLALSPAAGAPRPTGLLPHRPRAVVLRGPVSHPRVASSAAGGHRANGQHGSTGADRGQRTSGVQGRSDVPSAAGNTGDVPAQQAGAQGSSAPESTTQAPATGLDAGGPQAEQP